MLRPVEPISTIELFAPLHAELLTLLRQLRPGDWLHPTIAPGWSVKDMVAHLLDTDIRRLAVQRDGFVAVSSAVPPANYQELVGLINQLNAEWVIAARRISPRLLIELLDLVAPQVHRLFATLDPLATASASVAWAGESRSLNWFDLAREYTEKWHHQQHIREAVGAPLLTGRRWLHPALETFLRGLPHTYRDISAPEGTQLAVSISGSAGGEWALVRHGDAWQLYWGTPASAAARVQLDQQIAWRLFTRGITPAQAAADLQIDGDQRLGRQLLALLAIMA